MEASILIVSRNRKEELARTLNILATCIDPTLHEIRVFLDASTDGSMDLTKEFSHVHWESSEVPLGASKARSILYKNARGALFFGFDDDAHPLQMDFIKIATDLFQNNPRLGIIGFKEIKGRFEKEEDLNFRILTNKEDRLVNEFLGCGFAVKKEVYDETRGFPEWIDIYGEEACLSLEVLELGYDILYTHRVVVNHRVDKQLRKSSGKNLFRFQKQLKNVTYFYLVYYPFPLLLRQILRLYLHNFRKYAGKDKAHFKAFLSAFSEVLKNLPHILLYRKPVSKEQIKIVRELSNPDY